MGWFFGNDDKKDNKDLDRMSRSEKREYQRKMREAEDEREWDMLMMCEVLSEDD